MPRHFNVSVCIHIASPHDFWLSEFTYYRKFICSPKMKACSAFMVIHGHYRGVKTLSHPTPVLSQLRSAKAMSCLLFSALPLEMCPLTLCLVPLFYIFLWVVSLLKMVPKRDVNCYLIFLSARRLWYASWRKWVLGKLCLSMSYSAFCG